MSDSVRSIQSQLDLELHDGCHIVITRLTPGSIARTVDIFEILEFAGNHRSESLLFLATDFAPAFFDLKTGLAGDVLQKFSNYRMRAAIIGPPAPDVSVRFRELMSEANRGSSLRFLESRAEAVKWLAAGAANPLSATS